MGLLTFFLVLQSPDFASQGIELVATEMYGVAGGAGFYIFPLLF